jgi:hypothetical protein
MKISSSDSQLYYISQKLRNAFWLLRIGRWVPRIVWLSNFRLPFHFFSHKTC